MKLHLGISHASNLLDDTGSLGDWMTTVLSGSNELVLYNFPFPACGGN